MYPTDVIPEKNTEPRKFEYRPNNFLAGKQDFTQSRLSRLQDKPDSLLGSGFQKENDDSDTNDLEIELTEEEFYYAVEMTE